MTYVFCSNKTDRFKRLRKDKLHLHYCCNNHYLGVPLLLLSPCWSQILLSNVCHTKYGMKSYNFSHHTSLIMEGHVTFPLLLPHPPDYRWTSYISLLLQQPPPHAKLQMDKIHFPSCCNIPWSLIVEGQVTVKPYCLSLGQIWPPNSSFKIFQNKLKSLKVAK